MEAGRLRCMIFGSISSMEMRRIEAGILDNGTDFDLTMTPFEAGLGSFKRHDRFLCADVDEMNWRIEDIGIRTLSVREWHSGVHQRPTLERDCGLHPGMSADIQRHRRFHQLNQVLARSPNYRLIT